MPESLAQSAARRFPQPVRAGELVGRDVLQPIPSQARLGRVLRVTRGADGTGNGPVRVVIGLGGLLGFGARPVAVPADGLALLGDALVAVAYTPAQLAALPTDDPASSPALDPATVIRMGLAKPAH